MPVISENPSLHSSHKSPAPRAKAGQKSTPSTPKVVSEVITIGEANTASVKRKIATPKFEENFFEIDLVGDDEENLCEVIKVSCNENNTSQSISLKLLQLQILFDN